MSANPETLRKAILYKAKHRGSKEADLWVYGFVQEALPILEQSPELLPQLFAFIDQDDHLLFDDASSPNPSAMGARFKEYVCQKMA